MKKDTSTRHKWFVGRVKRGALNLIPLGIVAVIVWYIFPLFRSLGHLLEPLLGVGIPRAIEFVIGIALTLSFFFLFGFFSFRFITKKMLQIPVIGSIFLVGIRLKNALSKGDHPIVQFRYTEFVSRYGIVMSEFEFYGEPWCSVYAPNTPLPWGGQLFQIPKKALTPTTLKVRGLLEYLAVFGATPLKENEPKKIPG